MIVGYRGIERRRRPTTTMMSMLGSSTTRQSGSFDGLAGNADQSLSSSSSDSSSSNSCEYSNLFLPTTRSSSLQKDPVHGAAANRNDFISASARTAVTSNINFLQNNLSRDCISPPNCIDTDEDIIHLRSIFGKNTQKRYNLQRGEIVESTPLSHFNQVQQASTSISSITNACIIPTSSPEKIIDTEIRIMDETLGTTHGSSSPPPVLTIGYKKDIHISPLTPAHSSRVGGRRGYGSTKLRIYDSVDAKEYAVQFNPLIIAHYNKNDDDDPHHPSYTPSTNINTLHVNPSENDRKQQKEQQLHHRHHHHAQAFLLSLAFFFLWSPQNLLAPNLTQAAHDFGYDDENTHTRDLYLGSNLALAGSVLSLPISALIGFASDVVPSRMILMSATTLVGGMAAIGTGMSTTYPQLVVCRFLGGSCMSGSVPVVFSLLSDWFDEKDRNSASSGFTAMMGSGIILGQVYAGITGPSAGWRHSFFASGTMTMILAILVILCVREPVRGGKETVLRDMLASGRKYERKLTWDQFVSSIMNHPSNRILMIQGFFSNVPWGVMFVFLNDFLSQERGLSVPDATFIVAIFGVGGAVGGILGGFLGSLASNANQRYLPLLMSCTTLLGVFPFLALLDDWRYDNAGLIPCFYAFAGGCLASMPSVNIRPCLINVNPPEIRGAALTISNLIVSAARGVGPSFLTTILMGAFGLDRAHGFNVLIITFWTVAAIQLALLAQTLPSDQARMERELAEYAMTSMDAKYGSVSGEKSTCDDIVDDLSFDGDRSMFSIENQASSFDANAARQCLQFLGEALNEIGDGAANVLIQNCRSPYSTRI